MRSLILIGVLGAATACGSDTTAPEPDGHTGNHPPPRIIAGGGIGDGAIDGVVNLYVIDDATRKPIANAIVRVGALDGTTDATGLFIANGVAGPQTVVAKATNYRAEVWIGANGANMTLDLKAAMDPPVTSANLSGSITGFGNLIVPTGHHKAAAIAYSQDDHATDKQNNLMQPTTAFCDTALPAGTCSFTIASRTGNVAVFATIFDHDTKGDTNPANDTFTIIGWAARTGVLVQSAIDQTGLDLTLVDVGQLANVSIDFGSPPAGLSNVAAIPDIDLGTDGVMELQFMTPTSTALLAPKPTAFSGATYRLTGIANNGVDAMAATSLVLQRKLPGPALASGSWIAPARSVMLTRTGGSWAAVSGALLQGVEYDQGIAPSAVTHLLSITAFDGSTSFTVPDLVALPTFGVLSGRATALGGTIDLTNFAIDSDLAKVTGFSSQPAAIQ